MPAPLDRGGMQTTLRQVGAAHHEALKHHQGVRAELYRKVPWEIVTLPLQGTGRYGRLPK